MNTPQYNKLQNAVKLIRQFAPPQIELDYSIYSIRNLDDIFVITFKDGKLRNPNGKFAQNLDDIMLGFSGYLAEVILKNTSNTKLHIDQSDEKWYLNFTLTAENGDTIQPAQQVIKRMTQGNQAALYAFCLSTIKAFNQPKIDTVNNNTSRREAYFHDEANKKPWWKFW